MIEPVVIDLSEVAQEFVLSDEEIKSMSRFMLANIAFEYMKEWESIVDQNLKGTRAEYKRAMFSEQPDDYTVVIGLTPRESSLAMMIEEGASSFDIKEGFKNSDKVHNKGTDKWYLTVPFRWATSGALGESAIFANKMPPPIQKLVKTSSKPLKLGDLPSGFKRMGSNKTSGYNHKFNIFEGLSRNQIGSGGEENRGGYQSFRRVSENSDKGSWIHPGFKASRFMEEAARNVDLGKIVDFSVDSFLANKQ